MLRSLKTGIHEPLIDLYAARLIQAGLEPHGAWRCLNLTGGLLSWVAKGRLKLTDLDERMVERYLRHRARKQSLQPGDRAALKRLLSVLREAGRIAPAAVRPISPQDQIFAEFGAYLHRERGLAPKSVIRHAPIIRRLGTLQPGVLVAQELADFR